MTGCWRLAGLVTAALVLAGCAHNGAPGRAGPGAGGPARAGTTAPGATAPATTAPATTGPVVSSGHVPCTATTAAARRLSRVATTMTPVPGQPFGVAVTADGRWAFVSRVNSVAVLRIRASGPVLTRSLPAPEALGDTLTRDGRYLLVSSGSGATVVSVARAEDGQPDPVLGTLLAPSGQGAIETAVSPDGQLAFVSLENSQGIAVFRLARALSRGFGPADFAGTIPAGVAPVGMAVSPDGRWLYATSELERGATSLNGPGMLSVISVRRASRTPDRSVVATVTAGCSPVRVILSPDGSTAWVTARGSDALLAFR
ncbi:MAG TPA: hypothetical protein VFV41_00645, partial [Streptosporangiaceae bacterium]|nr:hypothetical protein [Streptosporangiaceae bacterium]